MYGNKKDYHHQGLGTKLFKEAEGYAAKHYKYLQVKTVDEGTTLYMIKLFVSTNH
ncbi:GNAT family N-acetyltransferase [Enterococcus faecium]|nr:GNAT family N-acetyltransferase [Enterococcus faecium]